MLRRLAGHLGIRRRFCMALLAVVACGESSVDSARREHTTSERFRVAILAQTNDPRMSEVREALAYWNSEFARLEVDVQLDSGTIRDKSVSDEALRAASDEVLAGYGGPAIAGLRASVSNIPADIIIALSDADLISFALGWQTGIQGIAVIRRADILPLSLPNTVRNVVAHELGHVFGLTHNSDFTTLMCGRPASCRPDAFASNTPRFFPLTASDARSLQERWP